MAIIKIRGVLVDILIQIAPDLYKSYVMTDQKGMKQLLVQCQNALYGTMVASLLYYRKFVNVMAGICGCHEDTLRKWVWVGIHIIKELDLVRDDSCVLPFLLFFSSFH